MRAVNLIPSDQRRGAGGVAGRAGGVAYVILAALGVLVLMTGIYAAASRQVSDRKNKLATVTAQVDAEQAQASALQPYVQFATLSQQRLQAVAGLASARFNWSAAMDQVARALPADVTLNSLSGGGQSTSAAAAAAAAAAGAAGGPTFSFTGCAASHTEVATVLVALRKIQGVANVALSTSTKAAARGAGASVPSVAGAGGATCPRVTFNGAMTFSRPSALTTAPGSPAGTPIPASGAAAQPSTQPATARSSPATTAVPR